VRLEGCEGVLPMSDDCGTQANPGSSDGDGVYFGAPHLPPLSSRMAVLDKVRDLAIQNDLLRSKMMRLSSLLSAKQRRGRVFPECSSFKPQRTEQLDAQEERGDASPQNGVVSPSGSSTPASRSMPSKPTYVPKLSRHAFASAPAPKAQTSEAAAMEELEALLAHAGIKLPKRAQQVLQSQGVLSRKESVEPSLKAIEDLRAEIVDGASRVEFRGGSVVRKADIVQVHLTVTFQDEKHRLLEREEVSVQSGIFRVSLLPLRDYVREDEEWPAAVRRALHAKVGLSPELQGRLLHVDASTCTTSTFAEAAPEYCGLRTEGTLYEVQAGLRVQPDDREICGMLGLPNGSDFAVMERRDCRPYQLHVWMWKSCEDQRLERVQRFKEYLASHGVDVEKFGHGPMKNLHHLYTEVNEAREGYLQEVPTADGKGTQLLRTLPIVSVRVLATLKTKNVILKSTEQYLDDGRRRKVSQDVVYKLRDGESWEGAWRRALANRLGLSQDTVARCFKCSEEKVDYTEFIKWSSGYPLQTQYKVWTVTANIQDPEHLSLADLGLPDGISFVSREGNIGLNRRGRLHVWTWEMLTDGKSGLGEQAGTGLDELCASLKEAEALALQTSREATVMSLGLDAPLNRIVDALRKALSQMARIDFACNEVNLTGLAGMASRERSRSTATAAEGLIEFVSMTFTQNRGRPVQQIRAGDSLRTTSSDSLLALEQITGNGGSNSIENIGGRSDICASVRQGLVDWHFDIFRLEEESQDRALQLYGEVVLGPLCKSTFRVGTDVAKAFLDRVAMDYYDKPYHNSIHAAQVAHLSNWLLKSLEVLRMMRGIERAGSLIAALCHDMKHFGRNNAFCIASSHPLALLYNDQSVLENMHSAACFAALREGDSSDQLMQNLKQDDCITMRSLIVKLILSTDMSEHFQAISKFRVKVGAEGVFYEDVEDRRLVATMCIKAADIGHSALEWRLHTLWSERVSMEFFEQGDEERALGLPVSALCDRLKMGDLGKAQKGFLEFVCMPLFQELGNLEVPLEEMQCVPESVGDERQDASNEFRLSKSSYASTERRSTRGHHAGEWSSMQENLVKTVCIESMKENAASWDQDRATVEAVVARLCGDKSCFFGDQR